MAKTMIRKHPLNFVPELPDVDERPLDINKVKETAYIKQQ